MTSREAPATGAPAFPSVPSPLAAPGEGGAGDRALSAPPLAAYLDDEYRRLRDLRSWYRSHAWLGWWDWQSENRVAVRTVVRLRWLARRAK